MAVSAALALTSPGGRAAPPPSGPQPASPTTRLSFSVAGQADAFPLTTQLSPAREAELMALYRFDHFDLKAVAAARAELLPLAGTGDAVAQFHVAHTYDLFELGHGNDADAKLALTWYTRAAEHHLARAEFFLYHLYAHALMHMPRDPRAAFSWLERAYQDAGGTRRAAVAVELGDLVALPRDDADAAYKAERVLGITPDAERSLGFYEEALALDPSNQSVLDRLFFAYQDRGRVADALAVADKSTNANVWKAAGDLARQPHPRFSPDVPRAVAFLARAAAVEAEDDPSRPALMELYTLVCQKRIARERLGPLFTPSTWEAFQRMQKGCVVPPGG